MADHDQEHARSALRRTLSTARRALGGRWLVPDRHAIQLDRPPGGGRTTSTTTRRDVTVGSRLATLETQLSPTELVLRWLAEAHAYDDLGSYSASLLDADPAIYPMDRLAREARESAVALSRGLPRSNAESAVRAAITAALVRVRIVLRRRIDRRPPPGILFACSRSITRRRGAPGSDAYGIGSSGVAKQRNTPLHARLEVVDVAQDRLHRQPSVHWNSYLCGALRSVTIPLALPQQHPPKGSGFEANRHRV